LIAGWRLEIPELLAGLAEAWSSPDAWEGMTVVAGVDLPGEQAGLFALDEIVMHGWEPWPRPPASPFEIDDDAVGPLEQLLVPLAAPEMARDTRQPVSARSSTRPAVGVASISVLGLAGRGPAWQR